MLQSAAEVVQGLLTKEVLIVFGSLLALYVGYKATKGGWSLTKAGFKNAVKAGQTVGVVGIVAATLLVGGMSGIGFGVGELASWEATQTEDGNDLTNEQLMALAGDDYHNSERILKYIAERNESGFTNDQLLQLHQNNTMQLIRHIASEKEKGVEFTSTELEALTKANSLDSILNYVNNRDNNDEAVNVSVAPGLVSFLGTTPDIADAQPSVEANPNADRFPLYIPWMSLCAGVAFTLMGFVTYIVNKAPPKATS